MSVLVNTSTRAICQGFTGSQGTCHFEQSITDDRRSILQALQ